MLIRPVRRPIDGGGVSGLACCSPGPARSTPEKAADVHRAVGSWGGRRLSLGGLGTRVTIGATTAGGANVAYAPRASHGSAAAATVSTMMTRSIQVRFLYIIAVLLFDAAVAGILLLSEAPDWAWTLLVLAFFVPGCVKAYYWRDFYRGSRLFAARRYVKALPYLARFLEAIARRPWLKKLTGFGWSQYGRDIPWGLFCDVEVRTLNLVGEAHLEVGNLSAAEVAYGSARAGPPVFLAYLRLGVAGTAAWGYGDRRVAVWRGTRGGRPDTRSAPSPGRRRQGTFGIPGVSGHPIIPTCGH